MMSVVEFFSQPVWYRLSLTLVHFLWQGLAVAMIAYAVVRLLRLKRGNPRYAAYLLAFALMAICPLITFAVLGPPTRPTAIGPVPMSEVESPGPIPPSVLPEPPQPVSESTVTASPTHRASLRARLDGALQASLPWALVGWMGGVLILSVRLLLGFVGVCRWRRHLGPLPDELNARIALLSERLGLSGFSRVFTSHSALEVVAVGYLRPLVLLPATMVTQMTPEMLEAVIAHELAHIRRLDLWVNLAQRIVETLLFYHPAVWWLSNRLRAERELCCDEMAVAATGERLTYASALESAQRGRLTAGQPNLALSLGQAKRSTLRRVRHILGLPPAPSDSRFWLAGAIVVVLLTVLAMPVASLLSTRADARTAAADGVLAARLIEAAEIGDVNAVRELLAQGADVNAGYGDNRQSPLLFAAEGGHDEVVNVLLDNGANVNASDAWGYTPLYYAIWGNAEDIVRSLISRGAQVDQYPRGTNRRSLTYAVWEGNPRIVRMLIGAGADVNAQDRNRWTALRYAVDAADAEVARVFIGTGVEIPPLHKAVLEEDLAKVRQLIAGGADVDTPDEFGWTPAYWALSMKHREILALLLDKGGDVNTKIDAGRTLLHQASRAGLDDVVRRLIAGGVDVNVRTNDGETPLMDAARAGHETMARTLIAGGAEVNAMTKYGRSALRDAAQTGRIEMVKLLVANGADMNLRNNSWGPLHIAANMGHRDIVDFLVDNGTDVSVVGTAGTPLHFAARAGRKVDEETVGQIIKKLLDHGADVNAAEKESGCAALHFAAQRGRREVARLLLAAGANVNTKDNQGRTPLSYTEGRYECRKVAELLRMRGAQDIESAAQASEVATANFTPASDPNLVAWWSFEEGAGSVAKDSSRNNHDGILHGNPRWTVGRVGGALDFDGADDYVDCGNPPGFNFSDQITVGVWVTLRSIPGEFRTVVAKGQDSWRLALTRRLPSFAFAVGGRTWGYPSAYCTTQVAFGEWHHICGTYNGETIRIFVDGRLDATFDHAYGIGTSDTSLLIGDNPQSTRHFWDGLIDEVCIFRRALSESEIGTIMQGRSAPTLVQPAGPQEKGRTNSIGMKLVWVPPGEFMMGSKFSPGQVCIRYGGNPVRYQNEHPRRKVTLTRGFWMGQAEVTQAQYLAIMGSNPSNSRGDDCPVEMVSWPDAIEFCRKLSEREGSVYSLPTEAQWEYAARAGADTAFCFGDDPGQLGEYAWYARASGWRTQPVEGKKPNAFGLYDMHGNVWEWCLDWYQGNYEGLGAVDPTGPPSGQSRVVRGGAWHAFTGPYRSAVREGYNPDARNRYLDVGFRVVMFGPDAGN